MLRHIIAGTLLGTALAAGSAALAAPERIVLAPTLFDSSDEEVRGYLGPAAYIEAQVGKPVAIEAHGRYEDIIAGFIDGSIDLAILGPLPFVTLAADFPEARPLVRFREADGRDYYHCVMIAFADDARPLHEYTGGRLALTQPFSTCGYFSAATILESAGRDINEFSYTFIGRHDRIATEVVVGRHDLGVIKDDVAARFASLGVIQLAASAPLPGFTLIANGKTLDAATRDRIRAAFLDEAPYRQAVDDTWPPALRQGTVPASADDYREIEASFRRVFAPDVDPAGTPSAGEQP